MSDESTKPDRVKEEKISLLTKAFDTFNIASDSLKRAYEALQQRVKELNLELEQKNLQLRQNLREKEAVKNYLDNVLQSIQNGVVSVDPEGRIRTFNKAAARVTQYTAEEAIGLHFSDVFGQNFVLETADGSVREITTNSGTTAVLSFNVSPMLDLEGQPLGFVISFSDVTRLKELEDQLRRNTRLAAMGEMAANLAHEIRNPLGSIKLFASILERNLEQDRENKQLATHIMEVVDTLDNSISNMLIYARSPEADFAKVNLNSIIEEAIESACYAINQSGIEVCTSYQAGDVSVYGDGRFLKQAFLNLILNGIQAMPEGGRLVVSTRVVGAGGLGDLGRTIIDAKPGSANFVTVGIADSGKGLPEEELPRIFEPFFSTKTKGTGLGLSIVKRVVQRHDGGLFVREPSGGGLEFIISLPLK